MVDSQINRRTYLQSISGTALGFVAFGSVESAAETNDGKRSERVSNWVRGYGPIESDWRWSLHPDEIIMSDTRFETGVYISGSGGPTAVIVAGQHGDEVTAQYAALLLTRVVPQTGTLVIIPLANAPAIRQNVRATEYGNLNRDWPSGREPTSELARAIWSVITSHDPDIAFDLHSSKGLYAEYDGFCQGVGQAIFPTRQGEPTADQIIDVLNQNYIESMGYSSKYEFLKGNLQVGISPLLSQKFGADLNIPSWLIETTECRTTLSDQITWHLIAVLGSLRRHGFEIHQLSDDGSDSPP